MSTVTTGVPMSDINVIPEEDLDDFLTIVDKAYPGMRMTSKDEKQRVRQLILTMIKEDTTRHLYGLYRNKTLLGGMILYDFSMNFHSVKTLAGGVGLVAVDLVHRREKVCKEMITYSLDYYKEKGSCITCLYPFRPDFYKEMGFGFGTKMHQYRFNPHQLPCTTKDHIQFVDKNDTQALLECYSRYTDKTHGMIEKEETQLNRIFENPEVTIVGYKNNDRILGYLIFKFERDNENFLINDILIHEFIYESRDALSELLTFLHTQKDQVRHVIINTQDEYFHHLFPDPRDYSRNIIPDVYHESNISGVGLMYRVIDTRKVFKILENHNFQNQTLNLQIAVTDSFFKENEGVTTVHFKEGKPHVKENDYDVRISLDIAEFSSLVMGVIPFRKLYQYNLADISHTDYIDAVTTLFQPADKPVCTTRF